jgi:iron complex transport system substrate-binding protein
MGDGFPQRIVCLTEEPTEVLYAIGEADRIVGISGFTVRPARARKEKPKISAFIRHAGGHRPNVDSPWRRSLD